jgi:cell division protein ZapB
VVFLIPDALQFSASPGRVGESRRWISAGYITGSDTVAHFNIEDLERQVDELIQICTSLREENIWLRARQATLVDDRAQLVEKTELVRSKVESMISRLKSLEDDL